MTEDAADDFQKVMDIIHSKAMLDALKELSQTESKLKFKAIPDVVNEPSHVKEAQLSKT